MVARPPIEKPRCAGKAKEVGVNHDAQNPRQRLALYSPAKNLPARIISLPVAPVCNAPPSKKMLAAKTMPTRREYRSASNPVGIEPDTAPSSIDDTMKP